MTFTTINYDANESVDGLDVLRNALDCDNASSVSSMPREETNTPIAMMDRKKCTFWRMVKPTFGSTTSSSLCSPVTVSASTLMPPEN